MPQENGIMLRVIYMSILNENVSIKIRDISTMSWDVASVSVMARPFHALVFRKSGSASFSHDNLNLSTNTDDVFYMPANYNYNAIYHEKNEIIVIHFESDLISKMENFQLNNPHIISLLFNRLLDIWNKKSEGYYYSSLSIMCEILENIVLQQAPAFRSETVKSFENAIEYFENNYTSADFSISELVEKAYISNTYFRKLFFTRFGTTPSKYLISKRLIYAEKLLSTGKHSVTEAATMSGFSDVKYFCRLVKKEYGVPPSRLYRHTDTKQKR